MANRFTWKSGSGALDDPNNWTDETSGAPGPPTTDDRAEFKPGTDGALTGNGVAQWAYFYAGSGPWTLRGTYTLAGEPNLPLLPHALTVSGSSLTVDGGVLNAAAGTIDIGYLIAATVTVDNAGQVTSLGTALGNGSGESGALVLSGPGTRWTDVRNPALDVPASTSGFSIVGQTGIGALTVTHGATLTSGRVGLVGNEASSSGTATLSDGGSWSALSLIVGRNGTGTLSVSDANATVSGGDGLNTGFLGVGSLAGSHGTLVIKAGGAVTNATAQTPSPPNFLTFIGGSGIGTATVSGVGATLDAGANGLVLGRSPGSSGTLTVSAGGHVTTGTPGSDLLAAFQAAREGDGTVTVTGAGSALDAQGLFVIGRAGKGELLVDDGAVVTGGDSVRGVGIGTGGGTAGFFTGGTGDATVSNGGQLISRNGLTVGSGGVTGTLTIAAQGAVSVATGIAVGVEANAAGVTYDGAGTITVEAGGTLDATGGGIRLGVGAHSTGTLDVAGTGAEVSATADIVVGDTGAGTLVVGVGALVTTPGTITLAHGGQSILTLTGGTIAASGIAGAGSLVSGWGTWQGGLQNDTTVTVTGTDPSATLDVEGSVSGTGSFVLGARHLTLGGAVSATQTIVFGAGDERLDLASPTTFLAPITGFGVGDAIEVAAATAGSLTGSILTLTHSGAFLATLSLTGAGGTLLDPNLITVSAAGEVTLLCLLAGTMVATPSVAAAVEALRPGDLVRTASGAAAPIVWIGRRTIDIARHPNPEHVQPIRIRAGAFADTVPERDLLLSPDHAIHLDGVLIPARLLVNGGSIVRDEITGTVEYFHVELPTHDLLLAEGLAVESYLDTGNRWAFAEAGVAADLAFLGAPTACARLAVDAATVEPAWRRLRARAIQLGLQPPPASPAPRRARLRLDVAGRRLDPVAIDGVRHAFALPAGATAARLLSDAAAPADREPWRDDRRRLGVAVGRVALHHGDGRRDIPLDGPAPGAGWWGVERADGRLLRWTDGDATLALPSTDGPALLLVDILAPEVDARAHAA